MLSPTYDQDIDKEKERFFFYFGDELGYIKLWDVTDLMFMKDGYRLEASKMTWADWKGHNHYFPNRIEGIEINHNVAKSKYRSAKKRAKKKPELLDPLFTMVQLRECKGHKSIINDIYINQ